MNFRRRNEAWKEIRLVNNDDDGSSGSGVCTSTAADMECKESGGGRVEEVSDDECRSVNTTTPATTSASVGVAASHSTATATIQKKYQHQGGLGALLGECYMGIDDTTTTTTGGGMVSDDNDGRIRSCSEESSKLLSTAMVNNEKRGGSSSLSSSLSPPDDSSSSISSGNNNNNSSNHNHNNYFWASPPTSLEEGGAPPPLPPRRVNTIGAGLAYGSDAWRSYQSKLDVRRGAAGSLSMSSSSRLSTSLGR